MQDYRKINNFMERALKKWYLVFIYLCRVLRTNIVNVQKLEGTLINNQATSFL